MYLVASPPQIGQRLSMYFNQLHYLQGEQRWLFLLLDDITLPLDFFIHYTSSSPDRLNHQTRYKPTGVLLLTKPTTNDSKVSKT